MQQSLATVIKIFILILVSPSVPVCAMQTKVYATRPALAPPPYTFCGKPIRINPLYANATDTANHKHTALTSTRNGKQSQIPKLPPIATATKASSSSTATLSCSASASTSGVTAQPTIAVKTEEQQSQATPQKSSTSYQNRVYQGIAALTTTHIKNTVAMVGWDEHGNSKDIVLFNLKNKSVATWKQYHSSAITALATLPNGNLVSGSNGEEITKRSNLKQYCGQFFEILK
jgi:hypothetical protein